MEAFGEYLKAQREKKGIRLEEIASITKIHLHSLQLLEQSRWEELPPEPFLRGFVTAYARYVGLDTKEVLALYYQARGHQPISLKTESPLPGEPLAPPPVEMPTHIESPAPFSSANALLAAGVAFALVIGGGILYVGKWGWDADTRPISQATESTAERAPSQGKVELDTLAKSLTPPSSLLDSPLGKTMAGEKRAASPDNSPTASAQPTADAPPAVVFRNNIPKEEAAHEVIIEGSTRSWVKIVLDDERPEEYFISENERVGYRARSKIKVVLGNAAGARVLHNGAEAQGSKIRGTIWSYKFPPMARFPQDRPPARPTPEPSDTPVPNDSAPRQDASVPSSPIF